MLYSVYLTFTLHESAHSTSTGSAVSARLTVVTNRQTDRHKDHTTSSVATGRIYAIHVICLTTDALQIGQPAQAVNPDFARAKFYRMHAWHRSIMDISQILRCTTTAMTNLWLLSLPSSVHTVKLVFDVWSSGLFCGCPEA